MSQKRRRDMWGRLRLQEYYRFGRMVCGPTTRLRHRREAMVARRVDIMVCDMKNSGKVARKGLLGAAVFVSGAWKPRAARDCQQRRRRPAKGSGALVHRKNLADAE